MRDALLEAQPLLPGSPLRVVSLYHLIASKLHAGGAMSSLDILELLDRNPELDLQKLEQLCERYNLLGELMRVLSLAEEL